MTESKITKEDALPTITLWVAEGVSLSFWKQEIGGFFYRIERGMSANNAVSLQGGISVYDLKSFIDQLSKLLKTP